MPAATFYPNSRTLTAQRIGALRARLQLCLVSGAGTGLLLEALIRR